MTSKNNINNLFDQFMVFYICLWLAYVAYMTVTDNLAWFAFVLILSGLLYVSAMCADREGGSL